MLNSMQRGFTLVELMIGIAIVGLSLVMAAPSFSSWIQSTQIRTAAEAVQNGLQLARGEAVRRNTQISFQLVTTLDSSCALSTAGPDWVISLVVSPSSLANVAGKCDKAPNNPPDPNDPAAVAVDVTDPYIVQKRAGAEGSRNAVIAAGQSAITFNGLGRVVNAAVAGTNIAIAITNPTGGYCKAASGPMRCLSVVVSPGGQILMCDPNPSLPITDPQRCP